MELKHLRAFVVLAQELHFGRAAVQLSIVQPALSMQIKQLESGLGVRLLDRNRHSVTLTDAGRVFLPEAQATLHQAARAAEAARASNRGEIGRVRLGFVSSVLPQLLPELIRAVHQRYPRIELELKDMPGPDQAAALKHGRLDFGLMRLPAAYPGVQTRVVLREPFCVALPMDHPLAAQDSIQPSDLLDVPVYILARHAGLDQVVFDMAAHRHHMVGQHAVGKARGDRQRQVAGTHDARPSGQRPRRHARQLRVAAAGIGSVSGQHGVGLDRVGQRSEDHAVYADR